MRRPFLFLGRGMAKKREERVVVTRRGGGVHSRKPDKNGWTPARRSRFIAELAARCNVSEASRAVGKCHQSAYRLRARSAEFRAQWAQAIAEGHERLKLMLLERAINGTVREIRRPGGVIERVTEYSERTALALLKMHAETAAEAGQAPLPDEEIEAVRKRIMRKLAVVRKRIEDGEA